MRPKQEVIQDARTIDLITRLKDLDKLIGKTAIFKDGHQSTIFMEGGYYCTDRGRITTPMVLELDSFSIQGILGFQNQEDTETKCFKTEEALTKFFAEHKEYYLMNYKHVKETALGNYIRVYYFNLNK